VSDIILAVTERQIAPGEAACFPFVARTAYGIPSIHEFNVTSDNPNFNPEWARIGRSAGDSYDPRYILEISPGDIGRSHYGAYPLRLSWRAAGTYRPGRRPVQAHHKAMRPSRRGTSRDNLADRPDLPAAGES
jgi:hypothetical protein